MQEKILIVDDDEMNLTLLENILKVYGYDIQQARNGEEAVFQTMKYQPDLILMDIMMPKMDGFQAIGILKTQNCTKRIPIIVVTALDNIEDKVKALEAGAEDFVSKPIEKLELMARVRSLLKVKIYNDFMVNHQNQLEKEVRQKTLTLQNTLKDLQASYLETIYLLSSVSEFRDETTGQHIHKVSLYSEQIARNLGLDEKQTTNIQHASTMHDIGKIAIPDNILLKPDKLNHQEWEMMKQHTLIGEKLLRGYKNDFVNLSAIIAVSHHERWDGSGYPYGLKGEDIPLAGRIVALADVFDALISHRPYKKPFTFDQAQQIIRENSGTHFDPQIVQAFLMDKKKIKTILSRYDEKRPLPTEEVIEVRTPVGF